MPPRRPVQSCVETYLSEIAQTPLLKAAEERELARRIRGDDDGDALAARNHLVRANLRLVVNLARKWAGHGVDLEDLIAEGNLGLFEAARRYDPARGTRFSTYATHWIKQAVRRTVEDDARNIRVPSYLLEMVRKWLAAGQPTGEGLLARMPASWRKDAGRTKARTDRAAAIANRIAAARKAMFAGPLGGADDERAAEPADPRVPDPCHGVTVGEDREALTLALGRLTEEDARGATVLRLRVGLDGEPEMTLKQIGERLGITRERVRQIEGMALNRLRELMHVEVPACRLTGYDRALTRAKRVRKPAGG